MDDEIPIDIPKVAIQPIRCLSEARELVAGQYWLFVGLNAVALLLGALAPMGILMGPMMCGLSMCYFRHMRRGEASFELLFKGFDHFVESLIATLVIVAVTTALLVPVYIVLFLTFVSMGLLRGPGFGNPPQPFGGGADVLAFFGLFGLVYLMLAIILLVLGTLTAFVYPLIVDRQLKAIPALKLSVQAVWANFWGMLGLTLIEALILGVAALCCYLPVFLVLPMTCGANLIAYRRVFPDSAAMAE